MNDGMKLSQSEIDALLSGSSPAPEEEPILTEADKDALGEIGNISFGSAATSLSTLLRQRVEITTPEVTLMRPDEVSSDFPRPYVVVSVEFTSGLTGANALAIELNDAKTIADLMLGGDGTNVADELNELHLSAVAEAMNQMMGGAATAMSSFFAKAINISPPTVRVIDLSTADEMDLGLSGWMVKTAFRLHVGTLIDSSIMQLVPFTFANEVLAALRGEVSAVEETAATAAPVATPEPTVSAPVAPPVSQPQQTAPPQMVAQAPEQSSGPAMVSMATVRKPEFVDFTQTNNVTALPTRNLNLLLDVALNVTVELGRTRRSIKDILDLAPGAILELDKLAGEPVDILVNNKRIAIGEVVVIDENFGVRITDIVSQVERVANLQ